MISKIRVVQQVIALCKAKNVRNIVISPGSRNAPMSISFANDSFFNCYTIPDERAAAFIALGIAQATQNPVALVCTSGSALLNYYPAVTEAFYQHIPLIVLSADRPMEWIDQGDGQTIRQDKALHLHLKKSTQLINGQSAENIWYNERELNFAFLATTGGTRGPVHINIPLSEPLYEFEEKASGTIRSIDCISGEHTLNHQQLQKLENELKSATKIMILVGLGEADSEIQAILEGLSTSQKAVVLCETTSNLQHESFIENIDRVIDSFTSEDKIELQPDLLITFGGLIISKKIKSLLRSPKQHWHISLENEAPDTYMQLTKHIKILPKTFFKQIEFQSHSGTDFVAQWQKRNEQKKQMHKAFVAQLPYSDFSVFKALNQLLPDNIEIQQANSSVVRYMQLFSWKKGHTFHANRGTSGIDGSSSTAMGYALANKEKQVFFVTGDISFFYDSNAFFHKHIPNNLAIVLIHNQGGGIFRIIDGPEKNEISGEVLESNHSYSAEGIANTFNVKYLSAHTQEEVESQLKKLIAEFGKNPVLLEVFTPREENDVVLKNYFNFLKNR